MKMRVRRGRYKGTWLMTGGKLQSTSCLCQGLFLHLALKWILGVMNRQRSFNPHELFFFLLLQTWGLEGFQRVRSGHFPKLPLDNRRLCEKVSQLEIPPSGAWVEAGYDASSMLRVLQSYTYSVHIEDGGLGCQLMSWPFLNWYKNWNKFTLLTKR